MLNEKVRVHHKLKARKKIRCAGSKHAKKIKARGHVI